MQYDNLIYQGLSLLTASSMSCRISSVNSGNKYIKLIFSYKCKYDNK